MGNEEEIQGGVRKPRESNHRGLPTSLRAGGCGGREGVSCQQGSWEIVNERELEQRRNKIFMMCSWQRTNPPLMHFEKHVAVEITSGLFLV